MNIDNKEWTAMKAFDKAKKNVDVLGIPKFELDDNIVEQLHKDYVNISNLENKRIEDFLIAFGGYKATLENIVSDIRTIVGLEEAAFNDGYSTALHNMIKEYERHNKKKPTKEELRGEILTNHISLRKLRQELLEHEAELTLQEANLTMYTTLYNSVSRVVSIRTLGQS